MIKDYKMSTSKDKKLIGIRESAALFNVHERTIRSWIKQKRITFYRLPSGVLRFDKEEFENILKDRYQGIQE